MSKPDLLLIAPRSRAFVAELERDFTVHPLFEAQDVPGLLSRLAGSTRFVATDGHHGCSAEIIAALPRLELIASYGVGYDAVDVVAARAAGVRVTNTPDVLNACVAEVTLALMLALCQRVPQADR